MINQKQLQQGLTTLSLPCLPPDEPIYVGMGKNDIEFVDIKDALNKDIIKDIFNTPQFEHINAVFIQIPESSGNFNVNTMKQLRKLWYVTTRNPFTNIEDGVLWILTRTQHAQANQPKEN